MENKKITDWFYVGYAFIYSISVGGVQKTPHIFGLP